MKAVAFTGHRCKYFYNTYDYKNEIYKPIKREIYNRVIDYIENKEVDTFITGGALGIDTISFFVLSSPRKDILTLRMY